ncbi:MAG: hypothetical protein GX649_02900 [Chloroflexi bacterium]|nr:hypothetical protein [Chloroflexota bacterium]
MVTDKPARQRAPRLPKRTEGRDWHPLTRAWWKDTWGSPMAEEYLDADIHGLFILAELVDAYWYEPSKELAGEIRLQRQCFGLTPVDRRRLQWEVQRVEPDKRPRQGRLPEAPEPAPKRQADDPRKILEFPREQTG